MSYEGEMMKRYKMPSREEVKKAILIALFNHNGVIKEFSSNEDIVQQIADDFNLSEEQRTVPLERIYRKEQRVVKTPLWHRLLYRAANELNNMNLVSNPKQTFKLTDKREWMLTEKGYDFVANMLHISDEEKIRLPIKSFEVQKEITSIIRTNKPINYNPIHENKRTNIREQKITIRERGFRIAIIESYGFRCAVCGLKLYSPDKTSWEVQAAHIVPKKFNGKDDIWNGISLCHFHHWAFDVGWFSITENYCITTSPKSSSLPKDFGMFNSVSIFTTFRNGARIFLPNSENLHPHETALNWHRSNVFKNQ